MKKQIKTLFLISIILAIVFSIWGWIEYDTYYAHVINYSDAEKEEGRNNIMLGSGIIWLILLLVIYGIYHFRANLLSIMRWAWEKEHLYKLAIIIFAFSILIIAISFNK